MKKFIVVTINNKGLGEYHQTVYKPMLITKAIEKAVALECEGDMLAFYGHPCVINAVMVEADSEKEAARKVDPSLAIRGELQ